jgi:formate hydrogenlyase transcriptional activator
MTPPSKKEHAAGPVGIGEGRVPLWVKDYALFLLDPDGRVVAWYSGAERIYGYKEEEIIGQQVSRLYPQADSLRGKLQEELKRATAEGHVGNEGWHERKNGPRFWANVLTTALRDDNQDLQGFARVVRDFTKRHRTEEISPQSGGRFKQRPAEANVIGLVSGEFDRITEASDAFLRMLGYSRED